jgi:uncharacterized protein with HEPN domain
MRSWRHVSPSFGGIIGFRNALIHGYDQIDDDGVWRTIQTDLPALRSQVAALLAELGDTP